MSGRAGGAAAMVLLLALALVLACLALVTSQHRSRGLFVELGRLQVRARDIDADGNRLRIELPAQLPPC